LILTLAAITAVVLALEAGGAPAAPKKTGGGKEPIQCEAGKVCQGTPGDDVINGSPGNDNINPYGGNDRVFAGAGDDYVHHSYGNDYIEGGDGADTLRGGFGNDTIYDNEPGKGDGKHDLLDCAWLASRGDRGQDEGFGEPRPIDTVVDCSNRDDQ
jgi:Ca2+-binding RTX toxin-like protein